MIYPVHKKGINLTAITIVGYSCLKCGVYIFFELPIINKKIKKVIGDY